MPFLHAPNQQHDVEYKKNTENADTGGKKVAKKLVLMEMTTTTDMCYCK